MTNEERAALRKQMAQAVRQTEKQPDDLQAVAKRFKRSVTLVRMACKEFGVKLPKAIQPKRQVGTKTFEILKALIDGEKQGDIAKTFGVSKQWISSIQKQAIRAEILKN